MWRSHHPCYIVGEAFFCDIEMSPPIRNRIVTTADRKLKETNVIPDKTPASIIIAPQTFVFVLYRNELTSPNNAPINPIHNKLAASSTELLEAFSIIAAHAPEHIAVGSPKMPPIMPKIIGAFEI